MRFHVGFEDFVVVIHATTDSRDNTIHQVHGNQDCNAIRIATAPASLTEVLSAALALFGERHLLPQPFEKLNHAFFLSGSQIDFGRVYPR